MAQVKQSGRLGEVVNSMKKKKRPNLMSFRELQTERKGGGETRGL